LGELHGVVAAALAVGDSREHRLGLDHLPDMVTHAVQAKPGSEDASVAKHLQSKVLQVGIVEAEHLCVDQEERVVANQEAADPENELAFKQRGRLMSKAMSL